MEADGRDSSTHQETKKFAATTRIWKSHGMILPWSFEREHGPANTLTLDLWPPALWENTLLLF